MVFHRPKIHTTVVQTVAFLLPCLADALFGFYMIFSDDLQASVIYTFGNGGAHQIVSLQLEKFARKTILLSSLVNFLVLKYAKEHCTLEEAHDKANEKKIRFYKY